MTLTGRLAGSYLVPPATEQKSCPATSCILKQTLFAFTTLLLVIQPHLYLYLIITSNELAFTTPLDAPFHSLLPPQPHRPPPWPPHRSTCRLTPRSRSKMSTQSSSCMASILVCGPEAPVQGSIALVATTEHQANPRLQPLPMARSLQSVPSQRSRSSARAILTPTVEQAD